MFCLFCRENSGRTHVHQVTAHTSYGNFGKQRRIGLVFTCATVCWQERRKIGTDDHWSNRKIGNFCWNFCFFFLSTKLCSQICWSNLHFDILLPAYTWQHYHKYGDGGHVQKSNLQSQQRAECFHSSRRIVLGGYYQDIFIFHSQ